MKASWGKQQPVPALKQMHMAHDYSTLLWEGRRWHGIWWGRVIMAEEARVSSMQPHSAPVHHPPSPTGDYEHGGFQPHSITGCSRPMWEVAACPDTIPTVGLCKCLWNRMTFSPLSVKLGLWRRLCPERRPSSRPI